MTGAALLLSILLALSPASPSGSTVTPRPAKPGRMEMSKEQFQRSRLRYLRRRIRDLRLEFHFVQQRIAHLPQERAIELRLVELAGVDDVLNEKIRRIFSEREARLQERLDLVRGQLAAAEKRLASARPSGPVVETSEKRKEYPR